VEKGLIKDFKIYGDFFGKEPVEKLEKLLVGARYEKEDISNLLKEIQIKEYFGDIPKNDFIELVYGGD
jgi:lipoate-protein ligase A